MYINKDWIAGHDAGATIMAHFGGGHEDATFYASALELLITGGDAKQISDPETGELIYEK